MAEISELAEGALVTYLKSLVDGNNAPVWPASMQRGAGDNFALRIFAGETQEDKDGQNIFCAAEKELSEHIPSSAIYEIGCRVILRTPTKKLTSSDKAATPPVAEPLTNHSAAAEALRAAMMVNGLELLLTSPYVAGAQGFTVFGILDRLPLRDQAHEYWESGFSFKLVACANQFPN